MKKKEKPTDICKRLGHEYSRTRSIPGGGIAGASGCMCFRCGYIDKESQKNYMGLTKDYEKYKLLAKKHHEYLKYLEKNKDDFVGQIIKLNEMWNILEEKSLIKDYEK